MINYILISFLFLSSINLVNYEENIIGEYIGGVDFSIWVTLKIEDSDNYTYTLATHTDSYIRDKGKWKIENGYLILNSSNKTRAKSQGEKIGSKRYLFKEFKYELKDETLIIYSNKKSKYHFKPAYFNLSKVK